LGLQIDGNRPAHFLAVKKRAGHWKSNLKEKGFEGLNNKGYNAQIKD